LPRARVPRCPSPTLSRSAARHRRSGTSLGPSEPAFPASGGPALVPPAGALVGLLPLPRGRSRPAAFGGSSVAERSAVNRLVVGRSEEHTSELQSRENLVC